MTAEDCFTQCKGSNYIGLEYGQWVISYYFMIHMFVVWTRYWCNSDIGSVGVEMLCIPLQLWPQLKTVQNNARVTRIKFVEAILGNFITIRWTSIHLILIMMIWHLCCIDSHYMRFLNVADSTLPTMLRLWTTILLVASKNQRIVAPLLYND